MLEQRGSDSVVFEAVTTGNFTGFDVWLENSSEGSFQAFTNRGNLNIPLSDVGLESIIMDAGGLERRMTVQRLPDTDLPRDMDISKTIELNPSGDTPVWVAVTTEDGYQAWSSPIYAYQGQ